MKTSEFKDAVEALDKRYSDINAALTTSVYIDDKILISQISEESGGQFSFNASVTSELPHLNSLLHGLIIPYAFTPFHGRIEPLYTLPIADGKYLWRQKDELTITSIPIRWDQKSIDNMVNDFNLAIDVDEIKERVN